jgi:hypothetical protein
MANSGEGKALEFGKVVVEEAVPCRRVGYAHLHSFIGGMHCLSAVRCSVRHSEVTHQDSVHSVDFPLEIASLGEIDLLYLAPGYGGSDSCLTGFGDPETPSEARRASVGSIELAACSPAGSSALSRLLYSQYKALEPGE